MRFQYKNLFIVFFLLLTINSYGAECHWQSVPIITQHEVNSGLHGGEGFQMVHSVVYAPSEPKIMYLSTDTSQVWKSTDGGSSWFSVRNGFDANGAVSLAVLPDDPDVVFAAGSYGATKQRSGKFPDRVEGLYFTGNGGDSWKKVRNTGFLRSKVKGRLLAFMKLKGDKKYILYVASSSEGLLKTDDLGKNWQVVNSKLSNITDIYVSEDQPTRIYVADTSGLYVYNSKGELETRYINHFSGSPLSVVASKKGKNIIVAIDGSGVFRSTDYGKNFHITNALNVATLAISSVNSKLMFAKRHMSRHRLPLVSTDGGETWYESKFLNIQNNDFDKVENQFWFSAPFAPNPANENIVFTVSNGKGRILKSTDSGNTWRYSGTGFTGARMKGAVFFSDGRMFFALTDHGVWATDDGLSNTFHYVGIPKVNGLRSVAAIAATETTMVVAVGSWKKQALAVSHNSGKTWNLFMDTYAQHKFIAFGKKNLSDIYADQYISRNSGKGWFKSRHKVMAIDDSGILYSIKNNKEKFELISSDDSGLTWSNKIADIRVDSTKIRDMEIDSHNGFIYIATSQGLIIYNSKQQYDIIKTKGLAKDAYDMNFVEDVAINNKFPGVVFAAKRSPGKGQSNGIFMSVDYGRTWVNINYNLGTFLTVWSIRINPYNDKVYIGTSLGIFAMKISKDKNHACS